jgi:hypothetical protein
MTGKPMSGKNQDVSSIIDKFDSVDDNDKTIQKMQNLFEPAMPTTSSMT